MELDLEWNDFWKQVSDKLNLDKDKQEFNNPESLLKLKPLFKSKWKKGFTVDDAYYSLLTLI